MWGIASGNQVLAEQAEFWCVVLVVCWFIVGCLLVVWLGRLFTNRR
jgi:fluoride ion exporter CrcB/FEX